MGLVVEHIHKSFAQVHVIKDLSMEVREGSIFGFLGANGAGKTTTMRMILDILRPDSGRITWNGTDVREVPRRNWGYLPEERGLYTKIRVEEQLLWTPTTMLMRIGTGSVAWWEIALSIVIMLIAIFFCTTMSARIYRFGILMYGQKPGLSQLIKLVRMQ